MRLFRIVVRIAPLLAVAAVLAAPANATTLIRHGLESLTAQNEMVVKGRVLDIHSYWNTARSFILTDVRLRADDVLKGDRTQREVTFTVMGGTVGDITTLVIGAPDLEPGSEYLLFLNREDLPGASQRLTVRDLMQGAFYVSKGRAFSQAARHPLLPDGEGLDEAPGGAEGLAVDDMVREIRQHAGER